MAIRIPPTVLAAVAASCLLTACSGSSAPSSSASTSTPPTSASASPADSTSASASTSRVNSTAASTTTTTSTVKTSAPPASSKADPLLSQIVLGRADLPTGWTATPTATPTAAPAASSSGQSALVACVGGKNTSPDKTASLSSDAFTQSAATITSSAARYRSQAAITADIGLLKSPRISACYKALTTQSLRASLPAGATIASGGLEVVPAPKGGPANVVAVATSKFVVNASGQPVTLYQTTAFITGRLIEAEVDFQGVDTAVPTALQEQLIDVVAGRAAKI